MSQSPDEFLVQTKYEDVTICGQFNWRLKIIAFFLYFSSIVFAFIALFAALRISAAARPLMAATATATITALAAVFFWVARSMWAAGSSFRDFSDGEFSEPDELRSAMANTRRVLTGLVILFFLNIAFNVVSAVDKTMTRVQQENFNRPPAAFGR